MAWVRTAPGSERMANILASHSLNADALAAHVRLYRTIMFGDSPLSSETKNVLPSSAVRSATSTSPQASQS